MYDNGLVRFAT